MGNYFVSKYLVGYIFGGPNICKYGDYLATIYSAKYLLIWLLPGIYLMGQLFANIVNALQIYVWPNICNCGGYLADISLAKYFQIWWLPRKYFLAKYLPICWLPIIYLIGQIFTKIGWLPSKYSSAKYLPIWWLPGKHFFGQIFSKMVISYQIFVWPNICKYDDYLAPDQGSFDRKVETGPEQ